MTTPTEDLVAEIRKHHTGKIVCRACSQSLPCDALRAAEELKEVDEAFDASTKCIALTRGQRIRDSVEHANRVADAAIFDAVKAEQSTRAQVVLWMGAAKLAGEERDTLRDRERALVAEIAELRVVVEGSDWHAEREILKRMRLAGAWLPWSKGWRPPGERGAEIEAERKGDTDGN